MKIIGLHRLADEPYEFEQGGLKCHYTPGADIHALGTDAGAVAYWSDRTKGSVDLAWASESEVDVRTGSSVHEGRFSDTEQIKGAKLRAAVEDGLTAWWAEDEMREMAASPDRGTP